MFNGIYVIIYTRRNVNFNLSFLGSKNSSNDHIFMQIFIENDSFLKIKILILKKK